MTSGEIPPTKLPTTNKRGKIVHEGAMLHNVPLKLHEEVSQKKYCKTLGLVLDSLFEQPGHFQEGISLTTGFIHLMF